MPSDANGVYSLPDGYLAVTGETIQASQHNPPLEDLASAMSQRLMRSGVAPMTGPLKIADGSTGSPAVQFNSDGTTGFYKTANGIGVSVGGTKVAEFTASGTNRMIGELIAWSLLSAPARWALPYGQTFSRSSCPELWTIAQDEIANGNTFFNNGNGSTTFGIGDLRGRVIAGKDNMGGTAANRLTSASGITGTVLGAPGGAQTVGLALGHLPSATLGVTIPAGQGFHDHGVSGGTLGGTTGRLVSLNDTSVLSGASPIIINGATLPAMSGTAALNGSGIAHNNVQPTLVCNFLLYVGA